MEIIEKNNFIVFSEEKGTLRIPTNRFDNDLGKDLDKLRDNMPYNSDKDKVSKVVNGVELELDSDVLEDDKEALYLVDSLVDKAEEVFPEYN